MSRQDPKKIDNYYDNIEYHVKARDFASKMKFRRLSKIREVTNRTDCVLELGCSSSGWSDDFKNWVGLDISKTALAVNKGKNVVQASALKLPFKEDLFSLVTMFNVIEHLDDPEVALVESIKILKCDGFLAIGSPPLVWELLLSGQPSNSKRKRKGINPVFTESLFSKVFVQAMLKHGIPVLKEFCDRLKEEILITIGRKRLPLRAIPLEPDYSIVGEDYDATYAYNPNAVVNFLRSRGFKISDLRSIPTRFLRLPTSDIEIILARKTRTQTKSGEN